jgi:hypothetical protein
MLYYDLNYEAKNAWILFKLALFIPNDYIDIGSVIRVRDGGPVGVMEGKYIFLKVIIWVIEDDDLLGLVRPMVVWECDVVREGFLGAVRGDWERYWGSRMCFVNAVPKWVRDEEIGRGVREFEEENGGGGGEGGGGLG